ncbi:hypothetical protein A9Q99_09655 [Gammaproteobacteria bacterium 45_16_T64]|nr:hypothetical protein A9Q99_09655 [Gammaproteobacteria bacterium 45_16_T64]
MKLLFKKRILSAAVAAATMVAGNSVFADANAEIADLKKRIAQIEQSVSKSSPMAVVLSGAVEVEAGYARAYDDSKSSDIVLATAELAVDADIAEGVSAHVGLLYEEDDTDLELDEGYISLEKGIFFVNAGQMYVPFGSYSSNLVSDPLTLEFGETRESTVEVGLSAGPFAASVYVFKGDIGNDNEEQSKVENFGVSLVLADGSESFSYEFGVDYISSFADTDGLTGALDDVADEAAGPTVDAEASLEDYVAGLSVDGSVSFGPINLIAEYTTALDEFNSTELAFDGEGAKPSAFNLEVGYLLDLGCETQFALAFQGTKEAQALGQPERRIAIAASSAIAENTSLSLEFARDTDYDEDDSDDNDNDGDGDTADTITLQLAVAF